MTARNAKLGLPPPSEQEVKKALKRNDKDLDHVISLREYIDYVMAQLEQMALAQKEKEEQKQAQQKQTEQKQEQAKAN